MTKTSLIWLGRDCSNFTRDHGGSACGGGRYSDLGAVFAAHAEPFERREVRRSGTSSIDTAMGAGLGFLECVSGPWCDRATARHRRSSATNAGLNNARLPARAAAYERMRPSFRHLGLSAYEPTLASMQRFTDAERVQRLTKSGSSRHHAGITLGLNASREHLSGPPGRHPVVQIRPRGPVTYTVPDSWWSIRSSTCGAAPWCARIGGGARECHYCLRWRAGRDGEGLARQPGVYVDGAKLASWVCGFAAARAITGWR